MRVVCEVWGAALAILAMVKLGEWFCKVALSGRAECGEEIVFLVMLRGVVVIFRGRLE